MDDDMPFLCPIPKCGKRFTNEDHLNVHSKTHEMSLALNTEKSSNSPVHPFVDQTPTPTKILKNFEEIGLFHELSKNPFDDAYKKALDSEVAPLPGPQSNELNTPTLIMTDTTRHVSTSGVGSSVMPLAVDKMKADKLKPSPLAQETFNGKKRSFGLDLSGKNSVSTSSSVMSVMRTKRGDLTSQDADSTSTDMPLDSDNAEIEFEDTESVGITQSRTSPHSTTNNLLSSAGKGNGDVKDSLDPRIKSEPEDISAQQCTMQVLLQLPNGQTVPISIPATINSLQMMDGKQQQEVKDQFVVQQQPQPQQQPPQQITQPPPLQPAPSKTKVMAATSHSTNITSMTLKQRLKAQLQNQLSPTAKSSDQNLVSTSNSAFVPAVGANTSPPVTQVFITHPATSPIMMMMDSPGSELNMSDSSDYSFENKHQKMSPDPEDPEDRRRKFLERNRAAAARCRQKRKHWIGNLERKADELQNTNLRLQNDVKLLRGEVAHLKTLLLAHKDCPVTQQQRSAGQLQQVALTDTPTSFSNQELAQVVPTGDSLSSDPIPMSPATIISIVSNSGRRPAWGGQAGFTEGSKDGMNE